ncbi:MAG: SDR family oxidoreductase [Candidatus Heimdallarchaeota archaeon]|nr:SDR family oxidoreductase [Candidatus Heimdallarchaeota archaeon]
MSDDILVTGASAGLGLSHALYLTSKGNKVIGTSRNANKLDLEQLKEIYIRDHTQFKYLDKNKTQLSAGKILLPKSILRKLDVYLESIEFISMDVSSEQSIKIAFSEFDPERIHVLVNNAGIGYFGPVEEMSYEQISHSFEVNFFGQMRVVQALLPYMRERKSGRIINTSSLGGIVAIPFQSIYSASKAAILRWTESLYIELKPFNIKISVLCPGDINTTFDAKTVALHHTTLNYNSDDIKEMKEAFPVAEESPYHDYAQIAWNSIIENLIISPPPFIVSKKLEKILKTKNPKVHYKIGSKLQIYGIIAMKRLLSETLSIKIIAMFYGY